MRQSRVVDSLRAVAMVLWIALPWSAAQGTGQAQAPVSPVATEAPGGGWQTVRVSPGDTLTALLRRNGVHGTSLAALLRNPVARPALEVLHPGETMRLRVAASGELTALRFEPDAFHALEVRLEDGVYDASWTNRDADSRLVHVSGTVETTLYSAGRDAGLPHALVMAMARIFAWDVDFARDVKGGDRFVLLYEEYYLDGRKVADGPIVAAEFVNRGQSHRAVRFEGEDGIAGYYTPSGRSLRKAFLRSPVDFHRISSGFSSKRLHPLLGVTRAHRGVDYAAAVGTPVRVTGNGTVYLAGEKGGYGKTVMVRHADGITTLYAHLSGFAPRLRSGQQVRQGSVIGYVGMTGQATGPHLHYEFRVDGEHRDPLTVSLTRARSIAPARRGEFDEHAWRLLEQLAYGGGMELAMSSTGSGVRER